jgi:hypothetical protein
MSRARDTTHVYVAADDTDQAVEDLTAEWSIDRRQRWTLDVDQPAAPGERGRPDLARRTAQVVRLAQLRAERDALAAVAPDATRRLEALDLSIRLDALEAGARPQSRGLGLT